LHIPAIKLNLSKVEKSNGKYGIIQTKNIVSEKAEMKVISLNSEKAAEAKIVVYDNIGNVVYEPLERDGNAEWNLTNTAGKNVANGTYLVVAEAKGINGKVYRYSVKVGARR
jgi:flagellar hook assembly protein FlgD